MANLSRIDIGKRDNINVLSSRVSNMGVFTLGPGEGGEPLKATGRIRVTSLSGKNIHSTSDEVLGASRTFANTKEIRNYEIEVEQGSSRSFIPVTKIFKDKEFGGVAGKSSGGGSERQELGLIDAISTAAASGEVIIPEIGNEPVIRAWKNEGLSKARQEPYIDVYVQTARKTYGVSCKGTSAPSLAGGGLVGINIIAPDLLKKLYDAVIEDLKGSGFKQGDIAVASGVYEHVAEIPQRYVKQLLIGNEIMGGPVDLMYIGPMDVKYNVNNGKLTFGSGSFYDIESYMRKVKKLYFRLRKRDLDKTGLLRIEYNKKNNMGYPLLFTQPNNNKTNARLVIVDKPTSTAKKLRIS